MSEFDISDGGGRHATKEDIVAVRDYLKSRNREHSIRKTLIELRARTFVANLASVQRALKKAGGGIPPNEKSDVAAVLRRATSRKRDRKRHRVETPKVSVAPAPPPAQATAQVEPPPLKEETINLPKMVELLVAENSSTMLAIRENRSRMALNIIIAETMAARPELLLLDMRCTGALVDALTVAAKLSGGASIDISVPSAEERASASRGLNGHGNGEMKDVTPRASALVQDIAKWRHDQKNGG